MAFLLTYDENMSSDIIQKFCPSATMKMECLIKDCKLVFRRFYKTAAITLEHGDKNESIPAVIWEITQTDLNDMDMVYDKEIYDKKCFKLKSPDMEIEAAAYVMKDTPITLPDEDYIENIMEAYCEHNFNFECVENALDFAADFLKKESGDNGALYKRTD